MSLAVGSLDVVVRVNEVTPAPDLAREHDERGTLHHPHRGLDLAGQRVRWPARWRR